MSFIRSILLLTFAALCLSAQAPSGMDVVPAEAPPREPYTRYIYESGATTYICWAKKSNELSAVAASAFSNAAAAVVTATAHGFHAEATPLVTISGFTGAWAAANGTWKASYVGANSFSIPVNSSGFGAVAGTPVVTTRAPRLTRPVWLVFRVIDPTSALYSSEGYNSICANKDTLPYE